MEKVTKEVVGGVFYRDGKVLIMRRAPFLSWAGWWEFPGGKQEKGESHEDCLARELKEELGIDARIGKFLTENSHGYDFGTVHLSIYEVEDWSGEISLVVHNDMRWVPLKELADFPNLLPADIPVAHALEKIFA